MIKTIKRPISILLAVLMVIGMFSALPISAGAADYVDGRVELNNLVAGDTLSSSSGDYLALRGYGYSVIIKGGTYIGLEDSEPQANDTEFQAEQIYDVIIRNMGGEAPLLTVMTAEGQKEYYPINGNNLSDKWYVLSNENNTVTLAGHVPADPVDYYVVGTMNNWEISDAYKLTKNPENGAEYMFTDLKVSANTELKVEDSNGTYYPDLQPNFKLNAAGTYDIYFRPDAQGGGLWYYGTIYANNYREPVYVAQIGSNKYETLADAFAAAQDGNTITLLADCTGDGIKAPQGKFANGLTVDFAGHTYTVNANTVGSTGTETNGFQLLKGNKITFQNGTITSTKAKILVQNYSDLTLDGMTLTLNNPDYTSAYTLSNNNGNIVIDGTTINANPAGGFAFDVCRYSSYPSVHVTVTGNSQINGDVEISASGNDAKQGFSLTLESGAMTGNIVVDASAQALVGEHNKVTKKDTFTKTAPAGFKWVSNEDGTSSLAPIPYVAKIGNTKYETLEAAFAAAQDGDTITVLANSTGNGIKAPQGKFATGLTVDFAGHTYTVDNNTVGSTGTETQAFQLLKDNKITFQNGTIYSEVAKMLVQNYSNLTLEGMTLDGSNLVGSGRYTLSNNNGNVVINNSTIIAKEGTGNYAFDVCRYSSYPSVNVTVKGTSQIKGDVEISASKGDAKEGFSLTLEGGSMTGNIVVDASAQALVGENNKVTKANTFTQAAPAGFEWVDNGDGTSSLGHVHDWDYENVSWTFTENETSHSIYAKYTLTCKTDPTHTKEQTGSGTLMVTVAVDGDKFVYSHAAVKIDGNSVAVPNYTRNVADGIINRSELVAASKVAGEYKLANDITGFYDSVKPVDGFVLDGQNNMIKYGTMNANNRVMFVAADQNTKFTLKNITLDGNKKAKWAVCAYTGNSGNNAGNVITLDTVTIQNFKSNDYVGAINAFGSSTWNLKDCTITGNTTTDDSDGLSGSAVWAGSKATINIDGGTYDEVYLHSYSGTGAVLNADGGATINNLVLDLTKTDTLKANIDDATVGAITANDDFIPEEAVVMDPTKANVTAPEGYQWIDSEETGMKTLGHIHDYTASFNWTQSAEGADWDCNKLTLTCACGDVQKNIPVTGYFGSSAVTCTANADGSFTYTVSKTVDGETYSDTKTVAAEGHIKTNKQLTAAAKKGGEWQLDNDLNGVVNVVCADGFVLNGQGYKVTRNSGVDTNPVFRINSNPAKVTLKNLIIDGIEGRSNTKAAIATKQSNPSAGNVLNLENVHIENYDISATNNGAVLAWGQATVNLTDCTVNTESTYDVWAGAAATVNINSGSFGDVYLNGGTSKATVDGGAIVSTVTYGASAQSQVAVEDGTVRNIALAEGVELAKENFIAKTPETALVDVPAGYVWVDSQTTGMKTLDKAQDLFVGHSITLNGNINLNFYINTNAIPGYANASSVKATFTWDSKAIASGNHYGDDVVVVDLKDNDHTPDANGWVMAYVPVNAAQMANQIEAKVYVGDGEALAETDTYSVMQYAKELLAGNYTDAQKTLVKKMLNYGAMAQKVFESQLVDEPDASANSVLSADDRTAIANEMNGVNADMIIDAIMRANGDKRGATVEQLRAIGTAIGGKWYTTSVIFLDGNTIRHYFDDVNEGVMNHAGAAGVQDTWFYYVEKKDIAASQLDTLYTFTIGGQSFQYSVLDYAAAVVESDEMGTDAQNLAKALYLYNQAANAYFG